MCGPVAAALAVGFKVIGDLAGGQAEKQSLNYQAKVDDQNAAVAHMQSTNALAIGSQEEDRQRARVRQAIGSQRAAIAANGIDPSSGSALDAQVNTAGFGEEDALTLRANAARKAWGYDVESNNYSSSAKLKRAGAKNAVTSSILSSGADIFGAASSGAFDK